MGGETPSGGHEWEEIIETEGENKGRVKDMGRAQDFATLEQQDRDKGATPEEANRNTEERIAKNSSRWAMAKELKSFRNPKGVDLATEIEYGGGAEAAHKKLDEIAAKGKEEKESYKKFQAELDREELDEVRAKSRENESEKSGE